MASTDSPDAATDGNTTPKSEGSHSHTGARSKSGWDGKLRVDKKAILTNSEALSDPEYSDEDAPPVEELLADEGRQPGGVLQVASGAC